MNSHQRRGAYRKAVELLREREPVSFPAWFGLGFRRVGRVVECGGRNPAVCVVKFEDGRSGVIDTQRVTVANLRRVRRA